MDEAVLVDTNVSLRSVQPQNPQFLTARDAIGRLRRSGLRPVVATQNLVEFWAIATRPVENQNGLGDTPSEAKREIEVLLSVFDRLPDLDAAFPLWLDLVSRYEVKGKLTHDARLVATMLANGVTCILTFNGADFARYAEILVEEP